MPPLGARHRRLRRTSRPAADAARLAGGIAETMVFEALEPRLLLSADGILPMPPDIGALDTVDLPEPEPPLPPASAAPPELTGELLPTGEYADPPASSESSSDDDTGEQASGFEGVPGDAADSVNALPGDDPGGAESPSPPAADQTADSPSIESAGDEQASPLADPGMVADPIESPVPRLQVVIVDPAIDDYQALLNGLDEEGVTVRRMNADDDGAEESASAIEPVAADPGPRIDVWFLDSDADGVEQISDILADYRDIDAVHVISHGSEASLSLGNARLDDASLSRYAHEPGTWGEALAEHGDLLLYGCRTAAGDGGAQFLDTIAGLTGADVAASVDDTGAPVDGGDFDLEAAIGAVDTRPLFAAGAPTDFRGLLAPSQLLFTMASGNNSVSIDYDGADITVSDGSNTETRAIGDISDIRVVGVDGEGDTLTIDFTTEFFIPILFEGGTGGVDTLQIAGGLFDTVSYVATAADAGTIDILDDGPSPQSMQISYSGLYDGNLPLARDVRFGDLLDFSGMLGTRLLEPLLSALPADPPTVQQLAALADAIEPGLLAIAHDAAAHRVVFTLDIDETFAAAAPFDYNLAIGALSSLQSAVDVDIDTSLDLGLAYALELESDLPARLIPGHADAAFQSGRIDADLSFMLAVGADAPVEIELTAAATADNVVIDDLLDDLNTAFGVAGVGVIAIRNSDLGVDNPRIELSAADTITLSSPSAGVQTVLGLYQGSYGLGSTGFINSLPLVDISVGGEDFEFEVEINGVRSATLAVARGDTAGLVDAAELAPLFNAALVGAGLDGEVAFEVVDGRLALRAVDAAGVFSLALFADAGNPLLEVLGFVNGAVARIESLPGASYDVAATHMDAEVRGSWSDTAASGRYGFVDFDFDKALARSTLSLQATLVDAASGTFGARLRLPNPDHALPAGLKCMVRFGAG